MLVFFFVQASFTDGVTRNLFTRLKRDPKPFVYLRGKGGYKSKIGSFRGILDLESTDYDEMAYLITEALVRKIEANSRVGVDNVDYKEITFGTDSETRGVPFVEPKMESPKMRSRREMIETLVSRYNYSQTTTCRLSREELCRQLTCEENMERSTQQNPEEIK